MTRKPIPQGVHKTLPLSWINQQRLRQTASCPKSTERRLLSTLRAEITESRPPTPTAISSMIAPSLKSTKIISKDLQCSYLRYLKSDLTLDFMCELLTSLCLVSMRCIKRSWNSLRRRSSDWSTLARRRTSSANSRLRRWSSSRTSTTPIARTREWERYSSKISTLSRSFMKSKTPR